MDRVFLDANILFSAAYRADSGLVRLWRLKGATLITSAYAWQEAVHNLETEEQQERLKRLIKDVEVVEPASEIHLPGNIQLPEKDRPILQAAILSRATHLLTGDVQHFGMWFGKIIARVRIMLPADYLNPSKKGKRK